MDYYGWTPYVSVAERQRKAEKMLAKAIKAGKAYAPVAAYRGALAKTVWGKQWCDNLAMHSDFATRLPRGRTYVRNGSVIDLQITAGKVNARVMGSSLYEVEVTFSPVAKAHWQSICKDCSNSIASLVEILQGKLSTSVMQRLCEPGIGLMPAAKAMSFTCSCPDWAGMCKHVAAVLYGVGARLDQQPELLFTLRQVDAKDLVQVTGNGLTVTHKAPEAAKLLDDAMLDVFGLDMAQPSQASVLHRTTAKITKSDQAAKAPATANVAGGQAKRVAVLATKKAGKPSQVKTATLKVTQAKKQASAKPVRTVRNGAGDLC
jgi:uncharacterized Zn finger protein